MQYKGILTEVCEESFAGILNSIDFLKKYLAEAQSEAEYTGLSAEDLGAAVDHATRAENEIRQASEAVNGGETTSH